MVPFRSVEFPDLSTLVPWIEQIGFGVVAGFVAGFALKKLGKLESLRQAQLTMLREYDPKTKRLRGPGAIKAVDPQKLDVAREGEPLPPLYWAGFVLSGDWR